MYIYNEVIKSIPGVKEICEADEALSKSNDAEPNYGEVLNPEVVGENYYVSENPSPIDFQGIDDLSTVMSVEDSKAYLKWQEENMTLYKACEQLKANYPYAVKALALDIRDYRNPTTGSEKALARLNAGDDYKAVLEEYEANPGYPVGDY